MPWNSIALSKMVIPMDERRKHHRLGENARVAVNVVSAAAAPKLEKQHFFCATSDVSVGGVKMSIHEPVPVGSTMELRIAIPGVKEAFRHVGHVAWIEQNDGPDSYSVGIEFLDADMATQDTWRDIIEKKASWGE